MKHFETSDGFADWQTEPYIPLSNAAKKDKAAQKTFAFWARGLVFSALFLLGAVAYGTSSKAEEAKAITAPVSAPMATPESTETAVPPNAPLNASVPGNNLEPDTKAPKLLVLTKVDRAAIQFVVKMHIASLNQQRADLFHKTFTKKTQAAFDSPDEMLVFFSIRYLPVVFAEDFRFSEISLDGSVPIQHGYLTDKRGKRWRVSYGLQNLGNSDWRIISSAIVYAPGDPA